MFKRLRSNPQMSGTVESSTDSSHLGVMSLIKDDVYNPEGKFLGEIEDIIVDTRSGCVRHVVLALGGFLGIGRQRLAVPWRALAPDANYQRCVVDVVQMELMGVLINDR